MATHRRHSEDEPLHVQQHEQQDVQQHERQHEQQEGPRTRARRRRTVTGLVSAGLAVIAILVLATWALWGFRWPPTVTAVEEPPEVSAEY